jgi:cell division protein FtsB
LAFAITPSPSKLAIGQVAGGGTRVNLSLTAIGERRPMVIRLRYRAILIPLALYVLSGAFVGYFFWQAVNGERGLKTKAEYKRQSFALSEELQALRAEHAQWEQRVALMRPESVDRDLLEEEAMRQLDRVDKRDLLIFLRPLAAN